MKNMFSGTIRWVVGYFLAGVFAILPLVITVGIVIWLVGFIENIVGPDTLVGRWIKDLSGVAMEREGLAAYAIGWLIVLVMIFFLGVFVESGLRQFFKTIIDTLVNRVPLVGNLYSTAQQLVGMLDKRGDKNDLKGMSVVFVFFGSEKPVGILALMPNPDPYLINDKEYYGVYLPTSPIPMTGGIVFVPKECVQQVDMSVDGLMSVYLSMGVTGPNILNKAEVMDYYE